MDFYQILDVLDVSAKKYPMKALAPEIGKGESTLRNELTQQDGYKLGLLTTILIMTKTGDLTALDLIERHFNRVAFPVPRSKSDEPAPIMRLVSRLTVEFGEHMRAMAEALDDGVIDQSEARECLKELEDILEAGVELKAHLEQLT